MGKMVKATSKTEFARVEYLKAQMKAGAPGVTQDKIDLALASARSLLEQEMRLSCERFEKRHGAEDWYKCMRAMYRVVEDNNQWRVISLTREWTEDREWVFESRGAAEDKINQLMMWQQSAVRRGLSNPDKHIERGTKILEMAEA